MPKNVRVVYGGPVRVSNPSYKQLQRLRRKWGVMGYMLTAETRRGKRYLQFHSYGGLRGEWPILKG